MPHTRQAAQARLDWGGELRVPPTPHARARSQPDRPVPQGDIILLGLRDFQARCPSPRPARPPPPLRGRIPERPPRVQDQKADIIQKYDGDEARSLKTYGELPDTVQINAGTEMLDGEDFGSDNFDFDEDGGNSN